MPTKHHFLHLSDLHFRDNWPEESGLVSKALFTDLHSLKNEFPASYLIFSGDLVQSGGNDGLYSAFHQCFDEALNKAGFPKDRRICIPGNHDISRDALKPKVTMQEGALGNMTEERIFNDNVPQLSTMFFEPTFKNYVTAEREFAEFTCCQGGLGGTGWELPNGVGIYCLNSALCSFGGLEDSRGRKIDDKGLLLVDTRSLYSWLSETSSNVRILIMHHPVDWLADWARQEVEKIIANSFQLVVSGHVHMPSAEYSTRGEGGSLRCIAPALFTRKSEQLGYSFITIDDSGIEVAYREWTSAYKFVKGTAFASADTGVKRFPFANAASNPIIIQASAANNDTLEILQLDFDEALISYSSKKRIWVERDLSGTPETARGEKEGSTFTCTALGENIRSCIIRAPKQFGLTCLGRFLALQYAKAHPGNGVIAMIDTLKVTPHRDGVAKQMRRRCVELCATQQDIRCVILDNWQNDKRGLVILMEFRALLPNIPVIVLQGIDVVAEIAGMEAAEGLEGLERLYLLSMTRTRIRELVRSYIKDLPNLEEDAVTKKVIDEIDSLNLHRTPLNCLTLLKFLEDAFDESPVNRTDMIARVLHLLFFEFQGIPRYSTRPDLKDCEHALGYVCQWLMDAQRTSFSKDDFMGKVKEYCTSQIIVLDAEILFSFLVSENIFVRNGTDFEFRFRYWMYYFAAHRMYHSKEFANFILDAGRYAAYPEIIEFYTGIDRTREDAVQRLTMDLRQMSKAFLDRTQIAEDFEPWQNAKWVPSEPSVAGLLKEVTESAADSALPVVVKDAIADKAYDPSGPYSQELAKFIDETSLHQMMSAVRGAARALRNSDYVNPSLKMALMEAVVACWRRVCQILAVLSPVLAEQGRAYFEGINFLLDESWDEVKGKVTFQQVLSNIPGNIAWWYQSDISSKKMGALFSKYIELHRGTLNEALILIVMAIQRAPGWDKEINGFIDRTDKNSFYLHEVFSHLLAEFKTSITNEKTRQQLRALAAKALAKHGGAKHPSSKVIERTAKRLDEGPT